MNSYPLQNCRMICCFDLTMKPFETIVTFHFYLANGLPKDTTETNKKDTKETSDASNNYD